MNVGTAEGPFKNTGYKEIIECHFCPADRTDAFALSVETVDTAVNMHESVLAVVQGGESRRLNLFAADEFG